MLSMFLEFGAIHHNVIQVYDDETVKEKLKNLIYKSAKHGWCIGETKLHYREFRRSIPGHT